MLYSNNNFIYTFWKKYNIAKQAILSKCIKYQRQENAFCGKLPEC